MDAMSLLGQVMQASAAANRGMQNKSGDVEARQIDKENRDNWRKVAQGYADRGELDKLAIILKSAPQGVDTSMYQNQIDNPGIQSQVKGALGKMMMNMFGGQPSLAQPTQPDQPNAIPTEPPNPAPDQSTPPVAPTQPPPPQSTPPLAAQSPLSQGMQRDLAFRAAMKEYAGIDVGAHYLDSPQWFARHDELMKSNPSMTPKQATIQTAHEFGFIPDGASNLDFAKEEKDALFEREFSSIINEPIFDATIKRLAPPGADVRKFKAGFALDYLAGQGRYIPDHYQPILDRFRGLEDPKFISPETQQYIYQTTGKLLADMNSEDVAKANAALRDIAILDAGRKAYTETTNRTRAQFAVESERPIKGEDLVKQGINPTIHPTYTELASKGIRFATDDERKVYEQMLDARSKLFQNMSLMFGLQFDPATLLPIGKVDPKTGVQTDSKGNVIGNSNDGIFTSIKPGWIGRASGKLSLMTEQARGTKRGNNAEQYEKLMADIARTLLIIDKDSRFSDQDVKQMRQVTGDLGVGLFNLPDSGVNAMSLIKRFIDLNDRYLTRMRENTTIGQGNNPASASPSAQQSNNDNILRFELDTTKPNWDQEGIAAITKMKTSRGNNKQDKYETGKIYTDAQGRSAKFLGDGQWEIQK
jgi:hypothetical protein